MINYAVIGDALLWIFIAYFVATFGAFVFAPALLVASLGKIDRSEIPANLRFNPLNALLSPKALTKNGRELREKGLRWLRIYLYLIVIGGIFWFSLLGLEKIIR